MNERVIIIDGIDRTGKDSIRRLLVKYSDGKYLVFVRGIISQIAYSRIYKRNIDEKYFFELAKNFAAAGCIFLYLKSYKDLIAQRIKDTDEKDINENDIELHQAEFEKVVFDMKNHGIKIIEIDNNFVALELRAKTIISMLESLDTI